LYGKGKIVGASWKEEKTEDGAFVPGNQGVKERGSSSEKKEARSGAARWLVQEENREGGITSSSKKSCKERKTSASLARRGEAPPISARKMGEKNKEEGILNTHFKAQQNG